MLLLRAGSSVSHLLPHLFYFSLTSHSHPTPHQQLRTCKSAAHAPSPNPRRRHLGTLASHHDLYISDPLVSISIHASRSILFVWTIMFHSNTHCLLSTVYCRLPSVHYLCSYLTRYHHYRYPLLFLLCYSSLPLSATRSVLRTHSSAITSSFPQLWPLIALYLFWALVLDKSPEDGGRSSQWVRSMRFWTYFAEYYPASYVCSYSLIIFDSS